MATMRMYCPSLKENVEATITDGKRVRSKGGSFRNVIYGEYEGRKCLPKTVKADVFAQHGFEAEAVPIGNVEGDGLLAVVNDVGDHKGFIELEDDEEEESVEIEITDEEMNEIAEIKLGAETFDSEEMIACDECGEEIGTREEVIEDEVDSYKVERNNSVDVLCYACYQEAPIGSFDEDYDAETYGADYKNCEICENNLHTDEFSYSEDKEQTLTPKGVVCNYCFGDILSDDFDDDERRNWAFSYLKSTGFGAETFESEGEYHLNGQGCEYCSEERELNAEGYCSECVSYAESYLSESILNPSKMSKEGKLALGLTAIGIGLAMFKADKIAEWFNKR